MSKLWELLATIDRRLHRFTEEQSANKFEVDPKNMDIIVLEYSALLGVSIVGVMQLLQVPRLDLPLYVSLMAFAVAIPLLAAGIYQARELQHARYDIPSPWIDRVKLFAVLSSVLGLIGIFWHFWWIAGILFISCILVAVVFYVVMGLAIDEANKEASNEEANRDTVDPNDRNAHT